MKTSIWKRFFRCGYDAKSASYNGRMAKTDKKTSRTRLRRLLDKLFKEEDNNGENG